MKKVSLYVALFAALGFSTMASADKMADHIFSETISGEIQALSNEEMQATKGEWGFPSAVGGGILSGIGYGGSAIGSGSWSWPVFAGTVAGGAVSGFVGGPASWYYRSRATFGLGVGMGIGSGNGYF